MKAVRIAKLKVRLSEYLRAVRQDETIAVFDRETPIAQSFLFASGPRSGSVSRRPGSPRPNQVRLSHTDLTMATHDTALGLAARAHGLPVVGVAAA
jgi:antitoxin (DNA-binding transcriptional repressor) of toxin-antitoxin stability system